MSYSSVPTTGHLLTGLAQLPNQELPPDIYSALAAIHMAVKNFDSIMELYLGIEKPTIDEAKSTAYGISGGLRVNTLNRIIVPENAATAIGNVVTLVNVAGVTKCQKAGASAGNRAVGIVTDVVDTGWKEVTIGMGVITGVFAGLTAGTTYWLTVATGGIANASAGTNPQIIGIALDANTLWMNLMGT